MQFGKEFLIVFAGDKEKEREREKEKEVKEKEKKRHRRSSVKRRARKSIEGSVKQPRNPIEIDWTKCVLYTGNGEHLQVKKITESDLKIENVIGRHRHGMVCERIAFLGNLLIYFCGRSFKSNGNRKNMS